MYGKGKDYDIIIKNLHTWPKVCFGSRWKSFSTRAAKQYTLKYHSHLNELSLVICGCRYHLSPETEQKERILWKRNNWPLTE